MPSVKPPWLSPGETESGSCRVHGRAPHCSGGGTGAQQGFSCAGGGGARWDGPRRPPPSRRSRPGQCTGAGQVPPAGQGGVRETPTGLQRALPHHRGEGAQALRGARRQAKGVLRVGFQVIHPEGRGRVEGPRDLGEKRGERPGWRERDRQTQTQRVMEMEKREVEKLARDRGKEKEEDRYSGTESARQESRPERVLGEGRGGECYPLPHATHAPLCRGRLPGRGARI